MKSTININKNLTLRGVPNTLLSQDEKAPKPFGIIKCEGNNYITLENFTITGGNGVMGGGVEVKSRNVTVNEEIIIINIRKNSKKQRSKCKGIIIRA